MLESYEGDANRWYVALDFEIKLRRRTEVVLAVPISTTSESRSIELKLHAPRVKNKVVIHTRTFVSAPVPQASRHLRLASHSEVCLVSAV